MIYSADRKKIKNRRRKRKEREEGDIHRGRKTREAVHPKPSRTVFFTRPGTAVIKAVRVSLKGLARSAPQKKAVIEGILMVSVA